MSDTRFTPGPYLTEGAFVYALDESGEVNRFSASLHRGYSYRSNRAANSVHTSFEELEATAKLFAASPDLYAALESLVEYYEPIEDPEVCPEEHERLNEARAALKKAKGDAS